MYYNYNDGRYYEEPGEGAGSVAGLIAIILGSFILAVSLSAKIGALILFGVFIGSRGRSLSRSLLSVSIVVASLIGLFPYTTGSYLNSLWNSVYYAAFAYAIFSSVYRMEKVGTMEILMMVLILSLPILDKIATPFSNWFIDKILMGRKVTYGFKEILINSIPDVVNIIMYLLTTFILCKMRGKTREPGIVQIVVFTAMMMADVCLGGAIKIMVSGGGFPTPMRYFYSFGVVVAKLLLFVCGAIAACLAYRIRLKRYAAKEKWIIFGLMLVNMIYTVVIPNVLRRIR